ncbi:von Willebrand factor A domain-containing protein 5A [Anabarilius grahami]|uniref:von Willebrand factor A domain-containing protein 5A n=1 Tax=Anabarilius grahami TaxID=495550 RepID=A0A3N0XLD8_ANAGA|nr:von Willebrand factor A domain-containing protein 5A [Anabarilius grahami]
MNCGLVTEKNEPVPLKSISVQVRVQDHVATVSSTLQYVNEEERPLEALFVFPLPADAAVCHFSAKIGEQEIVAEVQDKLSARDQYDDAVSSGQQAFLLEESEESPDVFRLSVGCLSPGQNAAVTIIYVTELAVQADHSLRFCLPAVLNPRYTPAGSLMRDPVVMISLYPEFPEEVMSLATQGEFVLVIDRSGSMSNTRIESAKVMQSLRFALQPAVVNISVDWTLPDGVTVDTLSPPINVLYQGQRSLIYAQLKGESSGGSEGTVTVKYSLKDQPVTNQLHFCLKPTEETGLAVHRLAAQILIRSLEQEERSGDADVESIRSRIVELSVQAGVSSVYTAFIAINKDSRQTVKGPLLQRRVPTHGPLTDVFGKTEDELTNQKPAQARDQYDDAVSSGQQAFLLEESEESPDVFRLSVGCLSPGQNAAVTIIYVTELAVQADHSLRFCLPAVLNPRYTPAGSAAGIVSEISSGCGSVPYTLTLSVHVSSPKPISKLESSCTLDPLVFLHSDHTQATVNLSPGHMFDKDVELFVFYQDTHQPSAIVEAGVTTTPSGSLMRDPVVMISLYPEFPEEVMSSLATQGEFVFVIDRSGSMDDMMHHGKGAQTRIESAKDTLLLLLKSLPMGCYFNIYGFGSRFESFYPKSVKYNQDTMDQALKRVKKMRADLGGTEILEPLKHIYSQPCRPNHPRQLFIFTDGAVGNTKEVLDLVKHHVHSHRCFSFGIGGGASTALITGMAREGSGHAQFITVTDCMQPKVMQSLKFALQPAVVNISVDWTLPDGITVDTLSPPINMFFQGQRALIYAHLKGKSSGGSEGTVTVKYSLKDQPVTNQLHFCLKPTEKTGLAIHRLAAQILIRSLEQEERSGNTWNKHIKKMMKKLRKRIVELSVQAGVSSVHTAFIAINKDSRQTVKGPLLQRRVKTQARRSAAPIRGSQPGKCTSV